jgi:electron transfer flavoprotein alpha subunit
MGEIMTIACVGLTCDADRELSLLRSFAALAGEEKRIFWLPGVSAGSLGNAAPLSGELFVLGGAALDIRNAETALEWLLSLWQEYKPDLTLFPASSLGHELAVRMSGRLGCFCLPEVRNLHREALRLLGRKKVCGSNLDWECTVELPAIMTVFGRGAIEPPVSGRAASGNIEYRPLAVAALPHWLLSYETLEPYKVNPLENAGLIFAAGRGIGNAATAERLSRIAACYGAPLGFSRPAALNGWGKIDGIIGQSGIKAAAETCLAIGISGSAAFMAGIEDVRYLIAVNTDPDAPIFQYADLGLIADAAEFIAALEAISPLQAQTEE